MTTIILAGVVISYGAIQFFELTAVLARIAGIKTDAIVTGYSIQQSVYMLTRFFMVALLPLLGFVVDTGTDKLSFEITAHLSLLVATIFGVFSLVFSNKIIAYYCSIITKYKIGGSFLRAFLTSPKNTISDKRPPFIKIIKNREALITLLQSNFVYLIYSTGIFVSFYMALLFSEYRASISQMSGVINAFGAVLLTFVVEPRISRAIDLKSKDSTELVFSLFWGRILATAISGQCLLFVLFSLT